MTTRSEAKPTPGPWHQGHGIGINGCIYGDSRLVANCELEGAREGEAVPNAALIVRAVNCHAQLVGALEHAHTYFLQSTKLTADDRDMLDEMWMALRAARGE